MGRCRLPGPCLPLLCSVLSISCGGTTTEQAAGQGGPAKRVDEACEGGCPTGKECTAHFTGTSPAVIGCSVKGNVAPGGACSNDVLGNSDCGPGSLCVRDHTGDVACHPYCATDEDCSSFGRGAVCWGFAANCGTSEACGSKLPGGFCVNPCTPFGTDCGPTGTCAAFPVDVDGVTRYFDCHAIGPGASGDSCTKVSDCGPNLDCFNTGPNPLPAICEQLCDADHGCPAGTSCSVTTANRVGRCK